MTPARTDPPEPAHTAMVLTGVSMQTPLAMASLMCSMARCFLVMARAWDRVRDVSRVMICPAPV